MSELILILASFACGFTYEVVWTACVHSVRDRRALRAANLSLLIYVLALASTVFIVEKNVLAVVAFGTGNWLGTFLTVRYHK